MRGILMKGLFIILLILIISTSAYALTVIPESPADNFISSSSTVSFRCSVIGSEIENISSVTIIGYNSSNAPSISETVAILSTTNFTNQTISSSNIPNDIYLWSCWAFNSTGSAFISANRTLTVNLPAPPPNTPPLLTTTLPNITLTEDGVAENAFDLDSHFSDSDALTFTFSGNTNIGITINPDHTVRIAPNLDFYGLEIITFTASDGSSSTNSNSVYINITPVDDAPRLYTPVPNQTWPTNSNKSIDLRKYLRDPDNQEVNYTFTSISNIRIKVFANGDIQLIPERNFVGIRYIIFTANDSKNINTSNNITLNITQDNLFQTETTQETTNAPKITYSFPLTNPELSLNEPLTFTIQKTDPNNDPLTVRWFLDNKLISAADKDTYEFKSSQPGDYILKAEVSDGSSITAKSWTIKVLSSKEKPKTTIELLCGNKKRDPGETCSSCPTDVKCASGLSCAKGICKEKGFSYSLLFIPLALMFIAGIVILIFILSKKPKFPKTDYKEFYKPKETYKKTSQQVFGGYGPAYKEEKPIVEVESKPKARNFADLDNFVEKCILRNIPETRLRFILLEKGWTNPEINESFIRVKKYLSKRL